MVEVTEAAMPLRVPQIQHYSQYRKFLADWFQFKKSLRPGFSYRRFSQWLGLSSPNFMQLVISGQRNLSAMMAGKFCRLNGFSAPERAYFLSLVRFEDAKSDRERQEAQKWMLIALRKLHTSPMQKVQEQIFSRWHHMLVRELVFLKDFEFSGNYVSKKLNGVLTEQEGEESLDLLLRGGFLVFKDGYYRASEPILDSGNSVFSHASMQKHHAETLAKWSKHLSKLNAREQELGVLHIPIAKEKIPELQKRIRRFQDEIIGWLQDEKQPDQLVQLGTYLISYGANERYP